MLATPTAHDGASNGISAGSRQGGPSLLDQLRLLPTPAAINPNDGEDPDHWLRRRDHHRARKINGSGMGMPLSIAVRLLPTPTASDAKNCTHRTQNGGPSLPDQARLLRTPPASNTSTTRRRTRAGAPPSSPQGPRQLMAPEVLLPTPRATDGTKGCPAQRGSKGDLMLPSAVMRLFAPQADERIF
jgi:DNA (cytosine-5)-methyltransferase 1